ncbi:Uncharacterised protein [Bordetella pertussis]|nr:Uncharacterised protein [Bordetella pertussis]
MTRVISNSPSADQRVASPRISRTGRMCSTLAASNAASSGGSSGTWYSSRNRLMADSLSLGQPRSNSPASALTANPSTLVWPDSQKVAAIEQRPSRARRQAKRDMAYSSMEMMAP